MSSISESLRTVRLGDVGTFVRGITFKPEDVLTLPSDDAVWCFRTRNVQTELNFSDLWGISPALIRRQEQFLQAGDILVSTANSWNLVGKCSWIPELPTRSTFGGFVSVLRPNRAEVHDRFLYHWFASELIQNKVCSFGRRTTNISNLDIKRCLSLALALPSLPEQRRIAAILDQAGALRVKRRAALAHLDKMAQAVFADMFGDIKTNERSWKAYSLGELCYPKQWPTITSQQLTASGYPVYGANGKIGYYSSFNHKFPTVLVTCRGATCGTINISPPQCYVTGNAMALDSPDPSTINTHFLACALSARGLSDAISGSAQPQITRQSLLPIRLAVPPIDLQAVFRDRVNAIGVMQERYREAAELANSLFASFQHRAFTGAL